MRDRLAELEQIQAEIETLDAGDPNRFSTVGNRRLSAEAQLRWVEETVASLPPISP